MNDLDELIDRRLTDLTDQYEKHRKKGNRDLAFLLESEALDLCERANDLESFLFFPIRRSFP